MISSSSSSFYSSDDTDPSHDIIHYNSNYSNSIPKMKSTSKSKSKSNSNSKSKTHQMKTQMKMRISPTSQEIIYKINQITQNLIMKLNQELDPTITISSNVSTFTSMSTSVPTPASTKSINNLSTCRSYTSTILLLSYIQKLLLYNKTTTTREIYYYHVTHFRSQRECDSVINDIICNLLCVERVQLGLYASPKGWFCGSFVITEFEHDDNDEDDYVYDDVYDDLYDDDNGAYDEDGGKIDKSSYAHRKSQKCPRKTLIDGKSLSSIQGIPITREWIHRASSSSSSHSTKSKQLPKFIIQSNAKCILIIEKEGIYLRLTEERFFDKYPCIIITGKGYPDIATRALVKVLHSHLSLTNDNSDDNKNRVPIPVYGLCDCNPFGVHILQTFYKGSEKRYYSNGGDQYSVPIKWIGLRPSTVWKLKEENILPKEVYQSLTELDKKKIEKLCRETNTFVHGHGRGHGHGQGNRSGCAKYDHDDFEGRRMEELEFMAEMGYKVELESLHWLGMDYISNWLLDVLIANERHMHMELAKRRREDGDEVVNVNDYILDDAYGDQGDIDKDIHEDDNGVYDVRLAI
jgi:DNA topoisomerase VI subunit A